MKRLFTIRLPNGQTMKNSYWESKELAKEARKQINGFVRDENDNLVEDIKATIARGPDHWRGAT